MPWKAPAVLLAVVVVLLALSPSPARAAEPGVVSDLTWGISAADVDRTVTLMRQNEVRWIRFNVSWKAGEQWGKGVYNEGYLKNVDAALAKVRAAGIEVVMPIADDVPYWASADPAKRIAADGTQQWNIRYRPADFADYADFAAYVAHRYKSRGVHVFEVGNEPNLERFWPSGVDAADYVRMLRAAYPAIKAADPQSTVLSAGLSSSDWRYLEQMYAAGAAGSFDALGIHPYSGDPDVCWNDGSGRRSRYAFCAIEELRKVMDRNGDAGKPMWATEFGWSTCSNAYATCLDSGVTESNQAKYLTRVYDLLAERYPYVRVALVYGFRNTYWQHDDVRDWEANLGLLRVNYSPKPALAAFRAVGLRDGRPAAPPTPPREAPGVVPYAPQQPAKIIVSVTPAPAAPARTAPATSPLVAVSAPATPAPRTAKRAARTTTRRARRVRALTVRGRVTGSRARTVRVRVQRRKHGRWRTAAVRRTTVEGTRFSRRVTVRRGGRVRVRAEARGTRLRSRYVVLGAPR